MSIDYTTGEVLDAEAAKRITSRIRLIAETLADNLDKLASLVAEARDTSAWLALGYRSWTEYVSGEFGGLLPRLEREPRRELVSQLAEAGMSTRAIAPVVGTSHMTVERDLQAETPVTTVTRSESVVIDAEIVEDEPNCVRPAPITGIDGKTYSRSTPIDHRAKADEAVAEFPILAYFRDRGDRGDLEHTWRLAAKLREFIARGEGEKRLAILRRSIEVDRAKRAGLPVPPFPDGTPVPTITRQTCPTCGQEVR